MMLRQIFAGGQESRSTSTPAGRSSLLVVIAVLSTMLCAPLALAQGGGGTCPGVPDVDESEGCGAQVNDGCDGGFGFTDIDCSDLVCATTWAGAGANDVDWYRLDVEDTDNSGSDRVTFQVRSSVPLVATVQLGCWDPVVQSQDCTFNSALNQWEMSVQVCAPALTTLHVRFSPGFLGSGPIIDGYPCGGSGNPYHFNVICLNECDEPLCPDCVRAPEGMSAWWPFDEQPGAPFAREVVANQNASYNGGIVVGDAGQSASSVGLDGTSGYLSVADSPLLDIGADDDFTIMGWIKINGGSGMQGLVSKFDAYNTGQGWAFALTNDDRLVIKMVNGGGNLVMLSTDTVPRSRWVHIALTVNRDSSIGGKFYINGNPAGVSDPSGLPDDLSNDQPLYLGAMDQGLGIDSFFNGGLDEIVMVDYPVRGDAIRKMAEAGCGGLCKQRLHVTRFTPFCDGDATTEAVITIFNDGIVDAAYDLTLDGVPANGNDCDIDGPILLNADVPNPIQVGALNRREVFVTITRPQGMNVDGDTGCWRALLTDALRADPLALRRGFVVQSDAICVEPLGTPAGVQPIPIGEITPFQFAIFNRSAAVYNLMWKIAAVDSVSGQPNSLLRLNNEEPGDPVQGFSTIDPGESTIVTVDTSWVFNRSDSSTKGKTLDVAMYEDPGKIEPDQGLGSKGGEATERAASTACEDADIDCDGDVDVDDLLALIAAYGECPPDDACDADIDDDGDVDVDDLLQLLAAFGSE
ncbi:MAG: LamG domain-containing protein [Phycisphaerales bacterium]|nr:LamG domain-containing protein [Phycisphaerales bacterium]